jgi:hypothetical protein
MSDISDAHMGAAHAALQRANFSFLDDGQLANLKKMESVNGVSAIGELLLESPDETVVRVARFREYEIALEQRVTDVVTAKVTASQAAKPTPTAPSTPIITYVQSPPLPVSSAAPKSLRVTVTPHGGEEDENRFFWFRENKLAMAAARIVDERQRITFAISSMKGHAKSWALTLETTHPGCFVDWATMTSAMKDVFLPPNVAQRQRAAFLACAQGDRELYVYVQELRQLVASMAASSIAEDVKLATFIENMESGPVKAAVFRGVVLLSKKPSRSRSRKITSNVRRAAFPMPMADTPPAEPMDLSSIDLSGLDLSNYDLSVTDARAPHVQCFAYDRMGHFQRNCPRNGGSGTGSQPRRGRHSGRASHRNSRSDASPGNVSSQ